MKKVAKMVVVGLVIAPIVFLGGCAKKCGGEPVMHHKLEKMKKEYGGK